MIHRRLLLLGLITCLVAGHGDGVAAAPAKKPSPDNHASAKAIAALDVGAGLSAALFASEPMMLNPTDIDVDERGRVWVCEVVNYRHNNGRRPQGDRILILEDTDGDGVADKSTVFYQGRDIDSALGICVLGNKVIVSCAPSVFVFTKDDQDKMLSKDVLFAKTGRPQHDHSDHAFVFGPDGRLYWNCGNEGHSVNDKNGKPVIDRDGHQVVDNGKPYRGGMVFRCELDGSRFEVLGHNFRNNYEVAVDSFGTLWQSDNDDDGNRGVRINYVMEHGNYGYTGELDGTAWQTQRTNIEKEIPLRHWHLNDPGVVPNLLQTGAGSPTGIMVYEGSLLPEVYRNQMIHTDAGPNVTRAYPVTVDGAGYKARIENILVGTRDNWFRPSDVCAAPDGSLIVADWYDPGVGGHRQGDIDHGRLFRVTTPGHERYVIPKFDLKTPEGAAEALTNCNQSVRYLAFTALAKMGNQAEPALKKLWANDNPRFRARALWLLGRLPESGKTYLTAALADKDPDLRIAGLRLARQLDLPICPVVKQLVDDPSPAVRRECALALWHNKEPEAAALWGRLAAQHDGKDRWYLEALGLGADGQWDQFLAALPRDKKMDPAAVRDITWRSRATATPGLLAATILDPATPTAELPRLMRAFDFQTGPEKARALLLLSVSKTPDEPARGQLISLEAIKRLNPADMAAGSNGNSVLAQALDGVKGTAAYVSLVDRFNLKEHYADLLALAQQHPHEQLGVDAIAVLLAKKQNDLIAAALKAENVELAQATAAVLGTAADVRGVELLRPIVMGAQNSLPLRREAARSLAKSHAGAQAILKLAAEAQFDARLKEAIAVPLCTCPWADVKQAAIAMFPLPATGNGKPLPTIPELLKVKGDVQRGHQIFISRGTCVNCHKAGTEGKDVGPALSEIGDKLATPAMFESIIYPSAGISAGFEAYELVTTGGTITIGLLVEKTADAVRIKNAEGIVLSYKPADVDSLRKLDVSIMPADVQKNLTAQDLADLVAFLATLKKPK